MANDEASAIQCTMNGCYLRFPSVEAMRKHKAKAQKNQNEHVHDFYCKRCDHDAADDIERFIHQIQSPKHIVCPACGKEFESASGRNRHVSTDHRQKQNIRCPGCDIKFTDASGLIAHIERNQCKIITSDDFNRHRAEQQIEQDAFEELQGGMLHSTIVDPTYSENNLIGGASLLEDQRIPLERDWQGMPIPVDSPTSPSARSSNPAETMSNLAIDKYPPLQAQRWQASATSSSGSGVRVPIYDDEDLLDMVANSQVQPQQSVWGNGNPWNKAASKPKKSRDGVSSNLLDSTSNVDLVDSATMSRNMGTARGVRAPPTNHASDNVPTASKPQNLDPNAPYATIQTKPQLRMPSRERIQEWWDPIQGVYVCPGRNCGRKLRSVKEFEDHLLSAAHAGGQATCPSCFKKFGTLAGLVAHAESGSMKCDLRKAEDFDLTMQMITAGMIRVEGSWNGAGNPKFAAVPIEEW